MRFLFLFFLLNIYVLMLHAQLPGESSFMFYSPGNPEFSSSLDPKHLALHQEAGIGMPVSAWNWDTLTMLYFDTPLYRRTRSFDQNFRIRSIQEEDFTDSWINTKRQSYEYDHSGQILTRLIEFWEFSNWAPSTLETYTYDDSGNPLSYQYATYNQGVWLPYSKIEYEYSDTGRTITSTSAYFTASIWENSSRSIYYLNTIDKDSLIVSSSWHNNSWYVWSQISLDYDSSGNNSSITVMEKKDDEWVYTFREIKTSDTNGWLIQDNFDTWVDSVWVSSSRLMNTYNSWGLVTDILFDKYYGTEWIHSSRASYELGPFGNLISHQYDKYQNGDWVPDEAGIYEADEYGNTLSGVHQSWYENSWSESEGLLIIGYTEEYPDYLVYPSQTRIECSWVQNPNSIHEPEQAVNSFFPNPTSHGININHPDQGIIKYVFTNLAGQAVLTGELNSTERYINIHQLPAGIYMIRLLGNQNSICARVIKK